MTIMVRDLSRHLADFKENGYTVLEQLFDEEQVLQWKVKYPQIIKDLFGNSLLPEYSVQDMMERYPETMLPLTANPVILDLLELIMGPFVQSGDSHLSVTGPNLSEDTADKIVGWHRDMYTHVPSGTDYQIPRQVLALTYLENMTKDTGPLRVLPGTHRKATVLTVEERFKPHPEEMLLSLKAGDVIVFSGLLHSASFHSSGNRVRMGGMYTYSWYKHNINFNGPNIQNLIEQAAERNDRRMLRLLGGFSQLEKGRINYGAFMPDETKWQEWIAQDKAVLQGSAEWWRKPLMINAAID